MYNQNNITNYPTPSRELVNKYSSKKTSFYCYYPMNGLWNETNTQSSYISSIEETFKDDKKKANCFLYSFSVLQNTMFVLSLFYCNFKQTR